MTHQTYKNNNQVNLKTELPRDVRKLINLISKKHRSTEEKHRFANKALIKLLKSYQTRNKRKYNLSQVNLIFYTLLDLKKYSRQKLYKSLYISKDFLKKELDTVTSFRRSDLTKKDQEQFKRLSDFEKEQGID